MRLQRLLPFLAWLPELRNPGTLRADVLAGLTGAVVVLPQGIAFATLAGMPAEYGLYTAMIPCIVAALFGASRLMVTGPANAISLTVLAMLAPLATPESDRFVTLAITLAFMVGLWQLLLGFARAGQLADYVSHTVIVGFTAGAAVLIINSQIRNFFGIDIPRGSNLWQTVQHVLQTQPRVDFFATSTALITMIVALVWRPLNRFVPALLVAIVAGAIYVAISKFIDPSLTAKTVDALPGALPPLSAPSLDLETLQLLLVPSIAMTLLALAEAVSIAQALARKRREVLNSSQEFIGQGLANVAGSFFSCYPSSGSFNRSGVNIGSGARTPFSAIAASLFLVAILFFVSPLAKYLPIAAVAAVLFLVAWGLIDRRQIAELLRHKFGRITRLCSFIATLVLPLEWAVLLGIAVSLVVARFSPRAK
ncbi:MAG: SulP family inorganic anion transporter [Betaproteobacteria bacterium]|nr:MAG: SulP family inorganic anion transporter [Betaproteobacteria bacterium]